MNIGLQSKHVVTGASSGIGFDSTSLFLREGAKVTACYKSDQRNLATLTDSKVGHRGLLMTLKNEIVYLAVRGRVNLVNPGWTITPMTEEELSDKAMVSRIMRTISPRKVAMPSDITHAILDLSSSILAGHVSGQTITLSGGMDGRILFTIDEADEYTK